jgi:hypothetical protein
LVNTGERWLISGSLALVIKLDYSLHKRIDDKVFDHFFFIFIRVCAQAELGLTRDTIGLLAGARDPVGLLASLVIQLGLLASLVIQLGLLAGARDPFGVVLHKRIDDAVFDRFFIFIRVCAQAELGLTRYPVGLLPKGLLADARDPFGGGPAQKN